MRSSFPIDFVFQPVAQRFVLFQRRPLHSRRGHYAGAEFADDLFPQFRVITRCCKIQFLERQVGSLDPVVMARDAIFGRGLRVGSAPSAGVCNCDGLVLYGFLRVNVSAAARWRSFVHRGASFLQNSGHHYGATYVECPRALAADRVVKPAIATEPELKSV